MTTKLVVLPEAAPLTSSQITKLLVGLLSGVARCSPTQRYDFPRLLASTHLHSDNWHVVWHSAFIATVQNLREWCDAAEVEASLAWMTANVLELFDIPKQN